MKPISSLITLSAIVSIGLFSFLAMGHGAGEHARCIADLVGQLQGACAAPQSATGEAASHIGIFKSLSEVPFSSGVAAIVGFVMVALAAFLSVVYLRPSAASSFQRITFRDQFTAQYFGKKLGHLIALRENSPTLL